MSMMMTNSITLISQKNMDFRGLSCFTKGKHSFSCLSDNGNKKHPSGIRKMSETEEINGPCTEGKQK
jgi:hypothetical protein